MRKIKKMICSTNAIWVFKIIPLAGALLPRAVLKAVSPDSERE